MPHRSLSRRYFRLSLAHHDGHLTQAIGTTANPRGKGRNYRLSYAVKAVVAGWAWISHSRGQRRSCRSDAGPRPRGSPPMRQPNRRDGQRPCVSLCDSREQTQSIAVMPYDPYYGTGPTRADGRCSQVSNSLSQVGVGQG